MLLLLGVEGSAPVSNSRCYLLTNEAETIAGPDSSLGEVRTSLLRLLSIWLVCQRVDTVTDYSSQSVARLIIASADGKPTDAIIVSLEHKDDYSVIVGEPYKVGLFKKVTFGNLFAMEGKHDIF